MKTKKNRIDFSVLNLCVVAFLGMILRSKMIFSMPFIDFNNLLEAHEHFAFAGWVTYTLLLLMIYELLPFPLYTKKIYSWMMSAILMISWILIFTFIYGAYNMLTNLFTFIFIIISYILGVRFILDIQKADVSPTVRLLSISSIICLMLSSVGIFILDYQFATMSLNGTLYRNALFTYLHLQYNGFFTLAVFALLFHQIEPKIIVVKRKNIFRFSAFLCISILPSMFLSYLWEDPGKLIRIIAISGSILVFISFIWFLIFSFPLLTLYKTVTPVVRNLGIFSLSAFALKMILQCLTIFPFIGNAVFGDRPMIIGFLHLVFLAFVTIFILTYFAQTGLLNIKTVFTKIALGIFTTGVFLNEILLLFQGAGAMIIKSNVLIPVFLWVVSIVLFCGTVMIGMARIKSR